MLSFRSFCGFLTDTKTFSFTHNFLCHKLHVTAQIVALLMVHRPHLPYSHCPVL